MLNILERVVKLFSYLEDVILNIAPLFLLLISIVAVFNRYFLKYSMGWYEEISIYLYMLLVYWGASKASKEDSHYSVSILLDKFKRKTRNYFEIMIWVFCLLISLLGVYFGMKMCLITTRKTVYLGIPTSIILFTTITMGFFGMSLKYLYKIVDKLINRNKNCEQVGNEQ